MRVAIFIDNLIVNSPTSRHVKFLISILHRAVDFVIVTKSKDVKLFGAKIIYLNGGLNSELKKEFKKGFDIIHLDSEITIHKKAIKLARKYNIPLSYAFHADKKENIEWQDKIQDILWIATQVDNFIVTYNWLADFFKDQGFTKKITVIEKAIDPQEWQRPPAKEWLEFRERKGMDKTFNILHVGNISPTNASEMLFQAFLKISKIIPSAKLIIMGRSPDTSKYVDFIEVNNFRDRVTWYNHIPDEQLPQYFTLGDVFISTTPKEHQCDWVIRSMMNSMPVIMAKNTFSDHHLDIGEYLNGLVYQDSEELVEKIKEIYSGGVKFYKKLQNNGLETSKKFVPEEMCKKYMDTWKEMVNNK